jgi:hypothetical protein
MIFSAPSSFQSCHSQNGEEEVYPKVMRPKGAAFVACLLSKSDYFGSVIERRVFIIIILVAGIIVPWSSRGFGGREGSAHQDINASSFFAEGRGSRGCPYGQSCLCPSY